MASLTAERITREFAGRTISVTAGADIFAGAMVAVSAGVAVPATSALAPAGVAQETVTSGGVLRIKEGNFGFDNDTTSAVSSTDLGKDVYVKDDHTVTADGAVVSGAATNAVAGKFLGFDDNSQAIVRITV